ncbi:MAG: signal peptidase I [Planctomycetota bacterium]|jgi:signal peptidase I
MEGTRRKPWLAALLSLLLAGLGHLYAGSVRRSGFFFLAEQVAMVAGLLLLSFWPAAPWNFVALNCLVFGWRIVAAADIARYAARAEPCAGRSAWIRWPVYAVVLVVGILGPALALRATLFEAFRVPQASMAATLVPGDRFITTKWSITSPKRGEIVVFRASEGVKFVKRVIGLPGDRVEVRGGMAFVNGERLEEPYVLLEGSDPGEFGPYEVPAGRYFLLGDNRNRSKDSRADEIGFVPADRIVARGRTIFFSQDPTTREIRWGRFGRPLQ